MIIGVVGFSWSGSSAAKDLLMEFGENCVFQPEFPYAYYPDSISDLDFQLNENCAKFLSSCAAIPRFRKASKIVLDKYGKNIRKITDNYIEKITQIKWVGSVQGEEILNANLRYKFFGKKIMINRILPKIPYGFSIKHSLYPLKEQFFSIRPDHFIEHTQSYMDDILRYLGLDMTKNIVLNQPFPGNNPLRCMKYFRDSKAIIVDRDPRDLYIAVHKLFSTVSYSVPHDRIDGFIEYYRKLHENLSGALMNEDVIYIKLEELIYEYDKTLTKIKDFLNLDNHCNKGKYFVPEMSARNTRLYLNKPDLREAIDIIEDALEEYLFPYDEYMNKFQGSIGSTDYFDENPLVEIQ